VAQMAGYQKVVAIAREAGMNEDIQPTPAVALGAYQVTPFEIARAYTIFANGGNLVEPAFISEMRDSSGGVVYRQAARTARVLDPRIAFLVVDMLQEVMRSGTAAGVRARGFKLPAAGKTGTSHDGWFAGFTSELLCVVWVGFDDNRELNLEGAKSALPIWAEFMKRAAKMRPYHDVKMFSPPPGVLTANVCADPQADSDALRTRRTEVFISGTEPTAPCDVSATPADGTADRVVDLAGPGTAKPPTPISH